MLSSVRAVELTGSKVVSEASLVGRLLARPQVLRAGNGTVPGLLAPPPSRFSPSEVAAALGGDRVVAAHDSASAASSDGEWTLDDLAEYFAARQRDVAAASETIMNVLSLEVSGTPLERFIRPPEAVLRHDWLHRPGLWPSWRRARGQFPRASKYCIMSARGSFTDFHCDFGGSSVWYRVLRGCKRFFLLAPPEMPRRPEFNEEEEAVPGASGTSAVSRLAFLAAVHRWTTRSRAAASARAGAGAGTGKGDSQGSDPLAGWLPVSIRRAMHLDPEGKGGPQDDSGGVTSGSTLVVDLRAGDTLLLPAGWAHAVWTEQVSCCCRMCVFDQLIVLLARLIVCVCIGAGFLEGSSLADAHHAPARARPDHLTGLGGYLNGATAAHP